HRGGGVVVVETDRVSNLVQGHFKQPHITIADDLASGHMPSFAAIEFDRGGGKIIRPGVTVVRYPQNIIEAVDHSKTDVDLRRNRRCYLLELNVGVLRPVSKRRLDGC